MRADKALPQENLARNVRYLMDKHGHTVKYLSDRLKGKVSRSAIHYLLNQEKIARIDTVEHIAQIYGLSGWHLISPTLIEDIERSPTISKLIANYENATPEGKRHIESVAEREAEYVAKSGG